jgi:hypothetical protein
MTEADRSEILAKARAINPAIVVFRAKRGTTGKIEFDRL